MASTTRESFRESIQTRQPRRLPEPFMDRMYDDYDRATRCAALRYYRSAFENPNRGREHAEVLRQRRRPALVIWGEDDPYVPAENAERQRRAFPDARVEILPDSGHWPFVDRVERVQEVAVGFLRPRLRVLATRGRPGGRRASVIVRAAGVLPALRARAVVRTLGRRTRVIGRTRRTVTVHGRRTIRVRLRKPLRPAAYEVVVRARGVAATHERLRVR